MFVLPQCLIDQLQKAYYRCNGVETETSLLMRRLLNAEELNLCLLKEKLQLVPERGFGSVTTPLKPHALNVGHVPWNVSKVVVDGVCPRIGLSSPLSHCQKCNLVPPPPPKKKKKNDVSIVLAFSWDDGNTHKKLKILKLLCTICDGKEGFLLAMWKIQDSRLYYKFSKEHFYKCPGTAISCSWAGNDTKRK